MARIKRESLAQLNWQLASTSELLEHALANLQKAQRTLNDLTSTTVSSPSKTDSTG